MYRAATVHPPLPAAPPLAGQAVPNDVGETGRPVMRAKRLLALVLIGGAIAAAAVYAPSALLLAGYAVGSMVAVVSVLWIVDTALELAR